MVFTRFMASNPLFSFGNWLTESKENTWNKYCNFLNSLIRQNFDHVKLLKGLIRENQSTKGCARESSILGLTSFLLYIDDLPDDVICNIAINADDILSTLSVIRRLDLWQQLELAAELESDLRDFGLGEEVACWFQCWKNSAVFVWPV